MRTSLNLDDQSLIMSWLALPADRPGGVGEPTRSAVARVLAAVVSGCRADADDCGLIIAWMKEWRRRQVVEQRSERIVAAFVVMMSSALRDRSAEIGGVG